MPLRTGTEMPELDGATEWVNGEANAADLRDGPTLVHFWAISCYICKDNMSTLQAWKETYGKQGLRFVAVHAPRGEDDLDAEKVRAAIAQFAIDEPCAIDNEHALVDRFQLNGLWPHYFLFDAEGKLRGRSAGNAGLAMVESSLKRLLEQEQATATV
jgi:thiol-disulfide isomerase/thioredoxin